MRRSTSRSPTALLLRAPAWRQHRLPEAGRDASIKASAPAEGLHHAYGAEGRADQALMLERLERPLPASWAEQRRVLWPGAAEGRGVGKRRPDAGALRGAEEAVPG